MGATFYLKEYLGFTGTFQLIDGVYHGEVALPHDVVTFHSDDREKMQYEFERSVDDYIAFSDEVGHETEPVTTTDLVVGCVIAHLSSIGVDPNSVGSSEAYMYVGVINEFEHNPIIEAWYGSVDKAGVDKFLETWDSIRDKTKGIAITVTIGADKD